MVEFVNVFSLGGVLFRHNTSHMRPYKLWTKRIPPEILKTLCRALTIAVHIYISTTDARIATSRNEWILYNDTTANINSSLFYEPSRLVEVRQKLFVYIHL